MVSLAATCNLPELKHPKINLKMIYLIDCVRAPVNVGVPVDGWGCRHPEVRGRMPGGGTSCFLIPWLGVRLQVGQVVPPMEDGLLAEVVEAVLELNRNGSNYGKTHGH
jgi:hypothetical protein